MRNKSLAQINPEIAKQWHPTKNGDLTPNDVTNGSHKSIWWKCPAAEDHEWQISVYGRTSGHGCPFCTNRRVVRSNCLATTHPEIAKQWHPIKNGNLFPTMITAGSNKRIWWKCPVAEDHEWQTSVAHRLNGRNCPCCSGHKVVKSTSIITTHPHLAIEWHNELNGNLTPEKVSAGSGLKVWWKCNNGHSWKAIVGDRANGNNCPLCGTSRGEKEIESVLVRIGARYTREMFFTTCKNKRVLRFDFMVECSDKHKLIEYQGEQHYHPVQFGSQKESAITCYNRCKHNDEIKRKWCTENKIDLLEIPYWDFSKIEEITRDFLNV